MDLSALPHLVDSGRKKRNRSCFDKEMVEKSRYGRSRDRAKPCSGIYHLRCSIESPANGALGNHETRIIWQHDRMARWKRYERTSRTRSRSARWYGTMAE